MYNSLLRADSSVCVSSRGILYIFISYIVLVLCIFCILSYEITSGRGNSIGGERCKGRTGGGPKFLLLYGSLTYSASG